MRTFAQKRNQPQRKSSANLTRSNTFAPVPGHAANPFLHLQSTIGNQAVLRLLQARADGLDARLQTKHLGPGDAGKTAAPPIVHEVLASTGQPLDSATRGFMGLRFGHDFSRVRVHTDAKAAESARAVNAVAYTVGHHMAFGAGQYVPETSEGRRLVAHELTHVVQQTTDSHQRPRADFASSSVGRDVLQRQPDKQTQAEQKRDQELYELARDPGEAHQAWKKLSPTERNTSWKRCDSATAGPLPSSFSMS